MDAHDWPCGCYPGRTVVGRIAAGSHCEPTALSCNPGTECSEECDSALCGDPYTCVDCAGDYGVFLCCRQ